MFCPEYGEEKSATKMVNFSWLIVAVIYANITISIEVTYGCNRK
jgi:hypothetical protein